MAREVIEKKRLVVVLGMHRSGTSAITKSLELLGVGLGENLHPAGFDNPKGYWEDRECIAINEELLGHLGSAYNRLDCAWDEVSRDSKISELGLRATQLITRKLAENNGTWGFKDPRTCRLIGFWKNVFLDVGCDISFVIAVRNPASVVASLVARDDVPEGKAYYLWLQHVLPPLGFMKAARRVVVDFDMFLENPYAQMVRISTNLGLPKPDRQNPLVRDFENKFLEKRLRHACFSSAELALDSRASTTVKATYDLLYRLANDQASLESPDVQGLLIELNGRLQSAAPAFDYINTLEDERVGLWSAVLCKDQDLGRLAVEVHRLEAEIREKSEAVALLSEELRALHAVVPSKDAALGEQANEIHRLESAVLRKDQDLGCLAEEVYRLEAEIREKSEALAQQAAEIHRLGAHAAAKQTEINTLGLRLHEAEAAMQELRQLSQRQASMIVTSTTELSEKETLMQTQGVELHARIDGLTVDLARIVEGFEAERQYFYAEVAKRDNLLADATMQLDQVRVEFQNLSAELRGLRQTRWFRLREVLLFHPFGIRKLIHLGCIVAGSLVPRSLRASLAPRLTRRLGLVTSHTPSAEDSGAYRVKLPAAPPRNAPCVVHVIANFMNGGSSRLVVDLVENLGDRYRQCVLTSYNPAPPAYVGLDIEECRFPDSVEPFIEYYKRTQPDLVHVHYWGDCDEPWYAKAIEAAGILGLPVIENINTPIDPYRSEVVAKYVYVSDYVRSVFGEADARHVTIYPGSDFNLFTRPRNEHAPEDCVGMVYRLERDKLNEDAIQPFIRIAELRPSTKILIVGGGSLLDHFKAAVKAAGVSGNFEFTGYVNYDVLPALYRRMSIFVAPVWKESFGQVSPFAMSMKVPVIGYDIGAIPEIIGTSGLVAPGGNAEALARIAACLLDSPEDRQAIGETQQQRAHANFSVQAMVDRYAEIYVEITNNVRKEAV